MPKTTTRMDVSGSASVHTFINLQEGVTQCSLYVRDELPDATLHAWDAFNATLPRP
jgi:hypothetical protein